MQFTVYERNTLDSFLESILRIERVGIKDDGEYTCTASNEQTSAWAKTIGLTVLGDGGKTQYYIIILHPMTYL